MTTNESGSVKSILATSASCGSDGFGFSRSILIESRAVLIVWTGDQLVLRISRQIAPLEQILVKVKVKEREEKKRKDFVIESHIIALHSPPHHTPYKGGGGGFGLS